ncbi:tRNA guanosine(15) transglycosylase TgtA [Halobacteriales archaeon SW_7_68_16]|nr:MAG: tRNA guanosine(15) transglycosylase TgtA [Halobacteriales archaeon SW_7_68_16]
MSDRFEIRATDAAGRIGRLSVPRRDATVETPALLPVVNPNRLTIPPVDLPAFGAQALITNGYIIYGDDDLRERAEREGLHEMLGFDGPIMTDSGSFQLAEYGEIDVTTREVLPFQHAIGSDIVTPVDVPTDPDADRETARADLETTRDRLGTAESIDVGDALVTGPVQGGTYTDLRQEAGADAVARDLDVFPVGAMVPLLNSYRYDEVVEAVVAAKRGLGPAAPVHLFGAGHPMTFALAAAMGCDLFDSAAYALFARDGRYLTVRGTEAVADLDYLPCECPVCVDADPADLVPDAESDGTGDGLAVTALARHNLHVSFGEIRRIRQAIGRGRLLELVEARARAHPSVLAGYRTLLDHADWLDESDPVRGDTVLYLSTESARRPAVRRHHDRLARLDPPGDDLLLTEGAELADHDAVWRLVPPFGPVPPALSRTYPLTAETPSYGDDAARHAAAAGVVALAEAMPTVDLTVAHRGWPDAALDDLPAGVRTVDLAAYGTVGDGSKDDTDAKFEGDS